MTVIHTHTYAGGYWLDVLDIGNDKKTLWPFHILRARTLGLVKCSMGVPPEANRRCFMLGVCVLLYICFGRAPPTNLKQDFFSFCNVFCKR